LRELSGSELLFSFGVDLADDFARCFARASVTSRTSPPATASPRGAAAALYATEYDLLA
jgi:hypothetical protein